VSRDGSYLQQHLGCQGRFEIKGFLVGLPVRTQCEQWVTPARRISRQDNAGNGPLIKARHAATLREEHRFGVMSVLRRGHVQQFQKAAESDSDLSIEWGRIRSRSACSKKHPRHQQGKLSCAGSCSS
jgi:hypothetical protein